MPTRGQVMDIPPSVAAAAARRALGPLVLAQRGPEQRGDRIRGLVFFGVGALVLSALLCWAGVALNVGLLGYLSLLCIPAGAVLLVYAVRVGFSRTQHLYLYAGGLVARTGRRVDAVAWPEVRGVTRRRVDVTAMARVGITPELVGVRPDSVLGYRVFRHGGAELSLKVGNVAPDQARFGAELERLLAGAGVPVGG